MAKLTTKDKVSAALDQLKLLNHTQLTDWAKSNGCDSASGFSAFKKALLHFNIDYEAMRAAAHAEKIFKLESHATTSLTLFSDAKAKNDRFGICDKEGKPVWHGRFFADDRDYNGEQSSGELAAAKKAVWLASKVKEKLGVPAINLTLKVDADWLCYANAIRNGSTEGGKARALGEMAQRYGVVLTVEHIPGVDNPADEFTVCTGFLRWQDADLTQLVD